MSAWGRRGVVVAGLVGAVLVSVASPGSAAIDDALIGDTVDGTAPSQYTGVEGVATCPPGERALGGGILQSGPPDDLVLRVSGPLDETGTMAETKSGDKPTQWYAAASNETTGSVSFRIYAVCADAKVTIEARRFAMPSGERKQKTVSCPGSKRAVGGGVIQSGSSGLSYVVESGPTDASGKFGRTRTGDVPKRWTAMMHNQGGSDFFKVFAICASHSHAKLKVGKGGIGGGDTADEVYTPCPGSKRAVGGGALITKLNSAPSITPTGPLDAGGTTFGTSVGDVPTQWYGGIDSFFPARSKLKVLAICE